MAELKRMIGGKRGEKLVSITTQSFAVPSSRIGNQFVEILSVDLDVICNRQWNTERVIVI